MIDKNDPRLTAYLLDELDADDVAEIESAMRDSDDLRGHINALRETIGVLHRAAATFPESESLALTSNQIDSIESAASEREEKTTSTSAPSEPDETVFPNLETIESPNRFRWQNFAIAALVLYAVGLSLFTLRGPADPVAKSQPDITARMEAGDPGDGEGIAYEMIVNDSASIEPEPSDATQPATPNGEDDRVRENFERAYEQVMEANIPDADDAPLGFPEAEDWEEMAAERQKRRMVENYAMEALDVAAPESTADANRQSGGRTVRFNRDMSENNRAMLENTPSPVLPPAVIPAADSVVPDVSENGEGETIVSGEAGGRSMMRRQYGARQLQTQTQPGDGTDGFDVGPMSERDSRSRARSLGGKMDEEMMDMGGLEDFGADMMGMGGGRGGRGGTRQLGANLDTGFRPTPNGQGRGEGRGISTPESAPSRLARDELEVAETIAFSDKRLNRNTSPASSEGGSLGDIELSFSPELGQIIAKGSARDVQRVKELITEIEEQAMTDEFTTELAALPDDEKYDLDRLEEVRDKITERLSKERKATEKPKSGKPAKQPEPKTWKPAIASTNRARLSVGHHDDLTLTARDTYVRIDGFRARVFFDCYYFNDRPQQLEGQFMLRLPNDASLHYFAFGPTNLTIPDPPRPSVKGGEQPAEEFTAATRAVDALRRDTRANGSDLARRAADPRFAAEPNSTFGAIKPAHVAPRQKAALAYEETVRRRVDPALVEWAGPGIFQTKVFPLLPGRLHRIIIGYDVSLIEDGDELVYKLDLPEGEAGGRVEFDVAAAPGTEASIDPDTEAFVSGGRAYYRFENAEPRDYTMRLSGVGSALLEHDGGVNNQYFTARLTADLPDAAAKSASTDAVFLLDTSWSDRPAAFVRRLELLEKILQNNRDSITRFAVLMFNVEQRWWKTQWTQNNETMLGDFKKTANRLVLEGATDLHGALAEATTAEWLAENDKNAALPNYFLLSDAGATWGKTDLASIADPLAALNRDNGGGALFAYHLAGHRSDKMTLDWLAKASGGAVFDVAEKAELDTVATAHLSRPWMISEVNAPGADEVLIGGASQTIYPGQPIVVTGRGSLDGPLQIVFRRDTEMKTIEFEPKLSIASPAAARLFGQFAVERLEPYADSLEEVTVAFARYFRVPGRTCSMVMLETAADYQRFGVNISPEEDQLVIASTSVTKSIEIQELEQAQQRANPRERFIAWVNSMSAASRLNVSTALKLAMKRLPDSAFRFDAKPLQCRSWRVDHVGDGFVDELKLDAPGFDAVMQEAEQRLITWGAADALKAASTLVEAKPSDVDTLRSVAFRALHWQRPDQAAPLLWRLTQARPYQPQCLLLLARAMADAGDTDGAIVCYDLVGSGNWDSRWQGAKDIAAVELLHVLEKVNGGQATSALPQYAKARLQQLRKRFADGGLDLAVIVHWNTDRTDVDLHVTEPSGEVCFFSHNRTKSGGQITQDITEGLGPEMYSLEKSPEGTYKVEAKYYSEDANRTKAPTEVIVTVLEDLGRENTKSQTKRLTLTGRGDMHHVVDVNRKMIP